MSGARYRAIYDQKGLLAEIENGETVFLRDDYSEPQKSDFPTPMVMRDIEPYKNMINGGMISSRSEHRELLKRHNCIEIGNETQKIAPPVAKNSRRETISRQLGDMSDRQANKLLKSLKKA